jgi:hypothetical protein
MQFILETQAQIEANMLKNSAAADRRFAQSEKRLDRMERVLRQTNRVVAGLASRGVGLRSDIRRHEKWLAKRELLMTEIGEKLDGLIDIVDNTIRKNGKR